MSAYFPTYNYAKNFWIPYLKRPLRNPNLDQYHPAVHMMAAISAGSLTNVLTQPLWFLQKL